MPPTTRHLHVVKTPTADEQISARVAELVAQIKTEQGPAYTHCLYSDELVPCPRCEQPAGMSCKTSGGWQKIGVHATRRNACAALDIDGRIHAYAERKAREEWARSIPLPPLTPEQLATRAAISEAFAKVEAEVRAEEREMRGRCRSPYVHTTGCTCRTDEEER